MSSTFSSSFPEAFKINVSLCVMKKQIFLFSIIRLFCFLCLVLKFIDFASDSLLLWTCKDGQITNKRKYLVFSLIINPVCFFFYVLVAIGVSRKCFISFNITCLVFVPDIHVQPVTTLKNSKADQP